MRWISPTWKDRWGITIGIDKLICHLSTGKMWTCWSRYRAWISISPMKKGWDRWSSSAWRREGAGEMLPQSGKKKSQHVCVKLCNEQCFKKVKSIVAQLSSFLWKQSLASLLLNTSILMRISDKKKENQHIKGYKIANNWKTQSNWKNPHLK